MGGRGSSSGVAAVGGGGKSVSTDEKQAKLIKEKSYADAIRNKRVNAIGIRYDNREFKVGAKVPRSNVWIDNERTPQKLPGTSSIGLGQGIDEEGVIDTPDDWIPIDDPRIMEKARKHDYRFGHAYLIAGEDKGYGEDSQEQIIGDAVVIKKLW
jgi:hypothetical protein